MVLAVAFTMLAALLAMAGALALTRANPGRRVPLLGRPQTLPLGYLVLFPLSCGCAAYAAALASDEAGGWAWLGVFALVALVSAAVIVAHNRGLRSEPVRTTR